jgi:REP element-mobilizing transposase RayT
MPLNLFGGCDTRTTTVEAALNLQLVLVTKYRRGVLTGKHLDTLGEVFASVGADFGAELDAEDAEDDRVQLLVASRRRSRSPGW